MNDSPSTPVIGDTSQSVEHLYWLDWLRFIAAFMVVALHARQDQWVEWGRLTESSQTKLGAAFFGLTRADREWVLVFFVLSGFLVGGKVIERVEARSFRLRDYAIDRVSRIWVPLVPALIWSAMVAHWVGKPVSWLALGGNLLGLQTVLVESFAGNTPLWSLAYEIWFYVLAGATAVWLLSGTGERIRASLAIALGFALFTQLRVEFLFAWVLGAMTYWLCSRPRQLLLATAGISFIGLGYLCTQLQTATVSVDKSGWSDYAPPIEVGTLILSLGIAVLLPYLTQLSPRGRLGHRLHDLGGKLAAFAYTLYLTHYPMLHVWHHYLPERHTDIDALSVALYLMQVLSCILFAWLCYLPFERQTWRVRRILKRSLLRPSELRESRSMA